MLDICPSLTTCFIQSLFPCICLIPEPYIDLFIKSLAATGLCHVTSEEWPLWTPGSANHLICLTRGCTLLCWNAPSTNQDHRHISLRPFSPIIWIQLNFSFCLIQYLKNWPLQNLAHVQKFVDIVWPIIYVQQSILYELWKKIVPQFSDQQHIFLALELQ